MNIGRGLGERDLARRRPGGERFGNRTGPLRDEGPQVGHAHAALAGAGAGEAGPLDEFEFSKTAVPDAVEIVDADLRTRAHDAGGGARGQWETLGRLPDGAHREVGRSHPREHVTRREAEPDDQRVAGCRRLVAVV